MTEMSQRHVQGREWTHEHDEWNLTLSDGQLVSRGITQGTSRGQGRVYSLTG